MKNLIKSAVALFLIICSAPPSFSQVRVDTVYFDANNKILKDSDNASSFEVRNLSKRGKPEGTFKRFNMKGELIESTSYAKAKKTGPYMLIVGDTIINGAFDRDKKVDLWTYQHQKTSVGRFETYNEKGQRVQSFEPLPDELAEKLKITSGAFFAGGPKNWNSFMKENLKFPPKAKNDKAQGAVNLKFVITPTGSIQDIQVVSSPHTALSEEAIRIMQKSPNWVPARKDGQKIQSEMKIRIMFRSL